MKNWVILQCVAFTCYLNASALSEDVQTYSFIISVVESALDESPKLPSYHLALKNIAPPPPPITPPSYLETVLSKDSSASNDPPPYILNSLNSSNGESTQEEIFPPTYEETMFFCLDVWIDNQYVLLFQDFLDPFFDTSPFFEEDLEESTSQHLEQ